MVKVGDTVKVDGIDAKVNTFWGQGKHKAYALSDGRVVLDLEHSISKGIVQIIKQPSVVRTQPLRLPKDEEIGE